MVPMFLIFISIIKLSITNSEPLCPKIYKCLTETNKGCYHTEIINGLTTISVKNCPIGHNCVQNIENPSLMYCEPTKMNFVPGLYCDNSTQCISMNCVDHVCQGKPIGEICSGDVECNVGLYCKDKKCAELEKIGSPCENDHQCEATAGCNNKKCVEYLSLDEGEVSNNRLLCKTMFVAEYNGVTMCARRIKQSPSTRECTGDIDQCTYNYSFGSKGAKTISLDCECTYTYADKKICPYSTEGSEFEEALKNVRKILIENGKNLHTTIKGEIVEDYKELHLKANKVFSSGVYDMESCVFDSITHNNFKLSNSAKN